MAEPTCVYDQLVADWKPTFGERWFLPPGMYWEDVADPKLAQLDQLLWPVIYGVVIILVLRYILETYVLGNLGLWLGVPPRDKGRGGTNGYRKADYAKLEESYNLLVKTQHVPRRKMATILADQSGISTYHVEKWLKKKRSKGVPVSKKFAESAFKVLFYSTMFTYGMVGLWNSPWLCNLEECWRNLPFDAVTQHAKIYYIAELSYYIASSLTLPMDTRRKDFKEMIVHHVATIFLIALSYKAKMWRCGALVMAIHDVSDIFLEAAKCANYSKHVTLANSLFVVFAIVFFVSRIIMLPIISYHGLRDPVHIYLQESFWDYVVKGHVSPAHIICNLLLIILISLHMFWMKIIVQMAIKFVGSGNIEKDDRSDHSDDDSDADSDVSLSSTAPSPHAKAD